MTLTLLYFISFLAYFISVIVLISFIYLDVNFLYSFTYLYFRRKDLQTQTVSRAAQAHPSNDTD